MYEDDGVSPAYKKGVYRRTRINVSREITGYQVAFAVPEGSYNPGQRRMSFIIKSDRPLIKSTTVTDDGTARKVPIR